MNAWKNVFLNLWVYVLNNECMKKCLLEFMIDGTDEVMKKKKMKTRINGLLNLYLLNWYWMNECQYIK